MRCRWQAREPEATATKPLIAGAVVLMEVVLLLLLRWCGHTHAHSLCKKADVCQTYAGSDCSTPLVRATDRRLRETQQTCNSGDVPLTTTPGVAACCWAAGCAVRRRFRVSV